MDINATLAQLDDLIHAQGDPDDINELCDAIADWLKRDGFEPSWNKHPDATEYYKARAVKAYGKWHSQGWV